MKAKVTSLNGGSIANSVKVASPAHPVMSFAVPKENVSVDDDDDQQDRVTITFPVLSVEKVRADGDKATKIGDTITYTITAKNTGAGDAENVSVTDALTGGAELVSITSSAGTVDGSVWKVGTLAGGGTATATVTVKVTDGSKITNTATIGTPDIPAADNPSAIVETEFAKRTIHYWYVEENGEVASADVVQLGEFSRNGTVATSGATQWGDWSDAPTFAAVTSPTVEGWNANRNSVDEVAAQRGQDAIEHVVYTPKKPVGTPDVTYGGVNESQTGTVTFNVSTSTVPDGSDNEIDKVELLDKDGNPSTSVSVDGGTYTLNGDGTITFTPDTDFVGDPTPVNVRGTDKNGESAVTTYTPHVVDNRVTDAATRTIHFKYWDENGNAVTDDVEQSVNLTGIKTVDPKTGALS
ncbi:MAG: DUF11 domain-containing protein, partial [Actinomycetaceae bacterium]|nr:DUF11 domain-containing protein [Actinomycetaceae bacterium]